MKSKKRVDTKKEILRVSARLFAERGYSETSTRDIAKIVGIASPSLYYHFESKSDILMELLKAPMDHLSSELQLATKLDAEKRVRRIVEAMITAFEFHNGVIIAASKQSGYISDVNKKTIMELETKAFDELSKGMTAQNKELRIAMAIGAIEKVVVGLNSENQIEFEKSFKVIKGELVAIVLSVLLK